MGLFAKIKRKTELISIDLVQKTLFTFKTGRNNSNILLLKLDAIGDYVLFRNFIEELHRANPNSKITLCGNILWKDLAENLDKPFIHEFIWVHPRKLDEFKYRYEVCKQLRRTKCATLIHPTYSRTDNSDILALASGAQNIVGYDGDTVNIGEETKRKNNERYTRLIPSSGEEMFEFYRYKHFFEELLSIKVGVARPAINLGRPSEKKAIVVFPGAGHENKRWPLPYLRELCNKLYHKYRLPFIICGSPGDMKLAEELTHEASFPYTNITGQKNLFELTEPILQAALVIANDSGPFHIAAAMHANAVCIFKGNHFGRFCPYPAEISEGLLFIYPEETTIKRADPKMRKLMYFEGIETDLSSIKPDTVFSQIEQSGLLSQ